MRRKRGTLTGVLRSLCHLSREAIVERLASRFKAGTHTYGWRYDPPAPNLNEGDYSVASAEVFPDGVLLINYNYRWGRLFLVPVTLAKIDEPRGGTRGFTPRDTKVEGASIQMHGMWIQESGYGCANFYVNGESGEAAGTWTVTDDAGKPLRSTHRLKKVEAR